MTKLLEIRETIRSVYYKYDVWFRVAVKFLLAFCVYFVISSQIGFEGIIQMPVVVLGLTLFSVCLPAGTISFLMSGMIVVGLWAIGVEIGVVALFVYVLMVLLYFVFKPKYSVLMAVAMLASICNVSGILPIATGLLFGPLTLVPMCLGIVSSYMIVIAKDNYSILASQAGRLTSIEKVIYYIEQLINNERMLLLMIAFVFTFMIVYRIRRMSYAYAWTVAIPFGLMVFIITMMTGNVVFGISIRLGALIASCVIGVLFAVIATFFSFLLDGTRTEYLEYEDEEYYYFVKAIPKVSVTAADKKVTRITSRNQSKQNEADEIWTDGFEESVNDNLAKTYENAADKTEGFSERNKEA